MVDNIRNVRYKCSLFTISMQVSIGLKHLPADITCVARVGNKVTMKSKTHYSMVSFTLHGH